MLIKSGLKLFIKKPFLNIIIILQISVTIVLTNLIIGIYNEFNEAFTLTKNFPARTTCFVMPDFSADREEEIQELLNKYKDEITAEPPLYRAFYMENNSTDDNENLSFMTVGYGEKTSDYFRIPLKEGCWFTEAESEECVPCVVQGEYNVGDIIRLPIVYEPVRIFKKPITEEEALQNGQNTKLEPVHVNFKVVGVLQDKYRILTFSESSNNLTLDRLFHVSTDRPALLFNQKDLSKFNVPIVFDSSRNFILYTKTDDPEKMRQITNEFRNIAWAIPFENAYEASKEELSSNIKDIMPFAVSVLLIGLVSSVCIIFLNAYNHIRVFSIYYICGMNWKNGFMIIFSYVMCLLLSAAAIIAGFILISGEDLNSKQFIINNWNIIFTAALFVLFAVITLSAPYFLLKKAQPLKQLKQGW